ncbi:serine hydrolase domain-containing protein [Dactylosporangium sp. AC04546]|uniref:serine hydrolase domain-containing protein n=1 Tax=Dactylosporangium sp. AC04546 TaxID=2862460 RepID=UPI001EDDCFF1|nr:beta-lactamase family protein [Dactylosporangium sp. AC04546]WVK88542.1 serine hydrolase domain-containing protein [Dactylosporangium sp. AC04546]
MVFKVDVPPELVQGDADEGYGPVADAFRRNFAERGEVGAACCVYRDGRKVVDLWGGYRDGRSRAPWREDTLVTVFSTTKGVSGLAVAVANARGLLDYDATVATYWPEFAAEGKAAMTVRQVLSHQGGLAAIDRPLSVADLADLDVVAAALAAQRPAWEPGTRHGYHAISLGWYEGELIRRVDPKGRSLGRFFADEVAAPLGAEFHIGVPDTVDPDRIAHIHGFRPAEMLLHMGTMPRGFVLGFLNPRSVTARSFANPKVLSETGNYNLPEVRRLELPAANGTGEVRAIARAYADAATGGAVLGLTPATLDALIRPAEPPAGGLHDVVLRVDSIFSLGYVKPFPRFRFGAAGNQAFGTPGAGGSFGFADPQTGIGFAYAMNRAGFHLWDDPRELALREALYRTVLGERTQHPDPR